MITVDHLSKYHKKQEIIRDLSFRLHRGERIGLLAPSGAGKTTLLHILSGLDTDFSGRFEIKARCRCTVFQEPGLFWYKSVAENICYPLKLKRIPFDDTLREQYREWLAVTGLAGAENLYPHQISGGMKQKTALIRAFLPNPDLVLLDEPFSWMDTDSKQAIISHIRKHYPDIAVLMASHALDEITELAQGFLLFREQKLSRFERIALNPETGFGSLSPSPFSGILPN